MNKIVTSKFFLPFMTALCLLLSTLPATSALAEIALRNVDVAGGIPAERNADRVVGLHAAGKNDLRF